MKATSRSRMGLCLALAATCGLTAQAISATSGKVPLPRPRPDLGAAKQAAVPATVTPLPAQIMPLPRKRPPVDSPALAYAQANVGTHGALFQSSATIKPLVRPTSGPFAIAHAAPTSAGDVAAVKRVIEAARKGKEADANAAEASISDPVARKLAEWIILRSDNTNPTFERYAAFVEANPSWPHSPLFRRRAENALWNDGVDDRTVRAFFARQQPVTAKGRYMFARLLLAQGDREGATALVRYAWRHDDASAEVEKRVLEMFGGMLSTADHKYRMEQRFYAEDVAAGLRAAERLGGDDLAVGRARAAVLRKAGNVKALLDAVPASARGEPGYIFAYVQWLRQSNRVEEAGKLILSAPKNPDLLVNLDQWWLERRLLVRKLLDEHDAHAAYRVAREAAPPMRGFYRVDAHFTAGWIALRYLHDPKTAAEHFSHISEGTENPHALARGGYWQGRAAEAMSQHAQAKGFYETAGQYTATYYGQLARARLGLKDLGLRGPPKFTPQEQSVLSNLEVVRAAEILYAIGERDMLASIYAELGESATDIAGMAVLGELAAKNGDGRAMLLLGEYAYARGLPLEYYAYPIVGLPDYQPIAPPIDAAVAYSIARQESHFNQKVVSSAYAMGLMQVTPAAGIDTATKYKVTYNRDRLLKDPVYNMQMGAAELSNLFSGYNGSYILTFAGYNAGRGRVKQWIAAYGDPRDPRVDPVDWVERIPIAETRNYVARIMENLQVYRARFGGGTKLLIEADLKRGGMN
ncbi:MAG TPA: lytic transglycosylase domain-containing protein [Pseudolabrys sp.]|nr:lytic transglycosylase domain-containing protein [Pseudolabrys sp.]